MVTLVEHVERLKKHCDDSPEFIVWSILHNERKMDEDSLLVYAINKTPFFNEMVVLWGSGDGMKIYNWVKDISIQNKCSKLCSVSNRWKALCRKYHGRPIGMMYEVEGFM